VHLHHWRALLATFSGDLDSAARGFQVAVDGHRTHGNPYLELTARYMLACALAVDGHAQRALQVSTETAALCTQFGERNARAYTDWAAGIAYWTLARLEEAERSAFQVLKTERTMGDGIAVALATTLCSWIAHSRNQLRRAADLSEAAGYVWRSLGTSFEAFGPHLSAFAEGNRLPESELLHADHGHVAERFHRLDDVIDFVLGAGESSRSGGRADAAPLTKRELEVAALIESGLSNREIAKRLVIAKRTADGHVERILAKLGFSSRAQVAAWMARHAS
jgi:ATP/maltotriose-dependent transcriptional regulator MalT